MLDSFENRLQGTAPESIRVILCSSSALTLAGMETLLCRLTFKYSLVATYPCLKDAVESCDDTNPDIIVFDPVDGQDNVVDQVTLLNSKSEARLLAIFSERSLDLQDSLIRAGVDCILPDTSAAELFVKALEKLARREARLEHEGMSEAPRISRFQNQQALAPSLAPEAPMKPQEYKVLREILDAPGQSLSQIADRLLISEKTLQRHLSSLSAKIDSISGKNLLELAIPQLRPVSVPEKHYGKSTNYRVLVVEDEIALCNACVRMLKTLGCEVSGVNSGEDALDRLEEQNFDVLFSDIRLSGQLNGIALGAYVSKNFPQMRVILTSGFEDLSAAGMRQEWEFFPKPYLMQELARVFSK